MPRTDLTDLADPRFADLLVDYTRLKDVQLRARREPAEGLFLAEGVEVRVAKGAIARRVDPSTVAAEAPADGAAPTDAPPEITEGTDPAHPTDDEQ